jgi:hypothetical protein
MLKNIGLSSEIALLKASPPKDTSQQGYTHAEANTEIFRL